MWRKKFNKELLEGIGVTQFKTSLKSKDISTVRASYAQNSNNYNSNGNDQLETDREITSRAKKKVIEKYLKSLVVRNWRNLIQGRDKRREIAVMVAKLL